MNTADILKYGHQTVLETLESLPKEQWRAPGVCGVWLVNTDQVPQTPGVSQSN